MKLVLTAATILSLLEFAASNRLEGRWESKPSVKGNVTGVVFKNDSSFEGYVNRKPFVSGHYTVTDTIMTFTDNGCSGAQGIYSLIFFSNDDSLRFKAVSDSCNERRAGMERLTLGRIK